MVKKWSLIIIAAAFLSVSVCVSGSIPAYTQHTPNQLGTRISLPSGTYQRAYRPFYLLIGS